MFSLRGKVGQLIEREEMLCWSSILLVYGPPTERLVGGDDNVVAGQHPGLDVAHLLGSLVVEHLDVLQLGERRIINNRIF